MHETEMQTVPSEVISGRGIAEMALAMVLRSGGGGDGAGRLVGVCSLGSGVLGWGGANDARGNRENIRPILLNHT